MKNKSLNMLCTLIMLCFCFAQCKKDKNTYNPEDQLPPATQTGANTFGCMVNGKVYIPKGYSGTGTPNPKVTYDVGLNGLPYFKIEANQFVANNSIGNFIVGIDSLTSVGVHLVYTAKKQIGFGNTLFPNCGILANDDTQFKLGIIIINKYEINQNSGIISGIFNFKIKPNNCDTLFFTDGRFDFKF